LIFNEVTPLSFQIYNRWGKKVFETGDISIGWDGKVGDKEQEIGTYMYIFVGLDERGNEFTMNGTITLLR
jgi:gliding motility-associated-like protein